MKISIIIPVYNEAATIREVLSRVRSSPIEKEIIVIDDGSTDGTRDLLEEERMPDTQVIFHPRNQGKGTAIRTGLKHATGDYVLIQDADLEYDPADYELLLRPILRGKATIVYGSRFLGEHKAMLFWHSVGNRMLTLLTNMLYDSTLTDMETCYKLFPTELIQRIPLRAQRFEFEPEITAKVLKRGYRIYEVPISYAGRELDEGKKISWRDGIPALLTLIKYRFMD
ncbi:MAG TPA: glycosyltransferase family 2 protein [Chloroflexota bacterium]|nr:glycosyltransferase family 2 protein [Chloroflexota bacterium]